VTRAAALLAAVVLATSACGVEARVGQVTQPIVGGKEAADDRAVVAVERPGEVFCSGALVGEHAVLTARHCVAPLVQASSTGGVVCGITRFGPAVDPASLRVSGAPDVRGSAADWRGVERVLVPEDNLVCGHDLALVVLSERLEVAPLEMLLDGGVDAGDGYSALGYGAIDTAGSDYGVRRRRDGLEVECLGGECASASVEPGEWLGPAGPCGGDSGGPALDADGRVVGVVSRALAGCQAIVYESPAVEAKWLESALVAAALPSEDDGCAVAPEASTSRPLRSLVVAVAAAALVIRRNSRVRRSDRSLGRRYLRSSDRKNSRSGP